MQGEGDALMDRWAMDRDQYKSRHSNRDEDASRDNNMADIALVDKNGFQIVQPSKKKRKHEMKMKMHAAVAMTESEVRGQHLKARGWCTQTPKRITILDAHKKPSHCTTLFKNTKATP